MLSNRHTQTHRSSTVTLAAHARRGLTTHEALAALLKTVTYHQLVPSKASWVAIQHHSTCTFWPEELDCAPRSDSMFPSIVTGTHTVLWAGQNGLPYTPDNLHLGCVTNCTPVTISFHLGCSLLAKKKSTILKTTFFMGDELLQNAINAIYKNDKTFVKQPICIGWATSVASLCPY